MFIIARCSITTAKRPHTLSGLNAALAMISTSASARSLRELPAGVATNPPAPVVPENKRSLARSPNKKVTGPAPAGIIAPTHARSALQSVAPDRFRCKIAPNAEKAIAQENCCGASLKIYPDGSRSLQGAGAAAVAFRNGQPARTGKVRLGPAGSFTEHQAELACIIVALSLAFDECTLNDAEVVIPTDSQTAIRVIRGEIPLPGTNAFVEKFYHRLAQLWRKCPHVQVMLRWVPAHTNVAGNLCADKEARAAARGMIAGDHLASKKLRKALGCVTE